MQTRLNVIVNCDEQKEIQGIMQTMTADLLVKELQRLLPEYTIVPFTDTADHDRYSIVLTDKHNG